MIVLFRVRRLLCVVCLKSDHRFQDCPFIVYGGNISSVDARRPPTYADVATVVSVSCPPPASTPVQKERVPENKENKNNGVNKEDEKDEENEEDKEDKMNEGENEEGKDGAVKEHLEEGNRSHDRSGVQGQERASCGGACERGPSGGRASGVPAQDWLWELRREREHSPTGVIASAQ